jgi:hypothetical protein
MVGVFSSFGRGGYSSVLLWIGNIKYEPVPNILICISGILRDGYSEAKK